MLWHDDYVQFHDPDYEGGKMKVSLRQGQRNTLSLVHVKKYITKR
ncbi:CPCC family cysteine-rich protein [Paenibacillus sp. FSL H7-0331]